MEAARKANVMFVDDEKRVLSSMRALFRRDYNVHLANSGSEALALLDSQEMDVIVSDQRMPGMTGVDVLKACKLRSPRSMRILLTGYADKDAIEASINEGEVFRYLTKPCARETLKETLELAVTAAGLSRAPANDAVLPGVTAPALRQPFGDASPPPATRAAAPETDRPASEPEFPAPGATPLAASAPAAVSTPAPTAMPQAGANPAHRAIDLMVLSTDKDFISALESALGKTHTLHTVRNVDKAVELLDRHPIGVVITDMAVNADEVQGLTTQLKHAVPELVTIVASDHSDAHRLIELINSGQVFRFLLKPIKPAQTAIWIESAVTKHLELVTNPSLVARHAVARPARSLLQIGDLFRGIAGRILRLRRGRS